MNTDENSKLLCQSVCTCDAILFFILCSSCLSSSSGTGTFQNKILFKSARPIKFISDTFRGVNLGLNTILLLPYYFRIYCCRLESDPSIKYVFAVLVSEGIYLPYHNVLGLHIPSSYTFTIVSRLKVPTLYNQPGNQLRLQLFLCSKAPTRAL